METEGLDFKGALESLADRFGVKLETDAEDPAAAAARDRRERLLALLDRAAVYYARYLWEAREAADARSYLFGRGLTEETLREFRVGYSPKAWDAVLVASRRAGFTDEELLAAGLVQRSRTRPGSVYDFFRSRIMFPSSDARGRVLGFGGALDGRRRGRAEVQEHCRERGLPEALAAIRDRPRALQAARAGRAILVEGYTDVLALHQAGIENAVAIMGTSFTEEQLGVLERIVQVLELCLDADSAGQEAMLRAARLAVGHKLDLRVVELPEGTDPAELVQAEGVDAVRTRVEGSVPFVVFHVERILCARPTPAAPRAATVRRASSDRCWRRCRRALCARSFCTSYRGDPAALRRTTEGPDRRRGSGDLHAGRAGGTWRLIHRQLELAAVRRRPACRSCRPCRRRGSRSLQASDVSGWRSTRMGAPSARSSRSASRCRTPVGGRSRRSTRAIS